MEKRRGRWIEAPGTVKRGEPDIRELTGVEQGRGKALRVWWPGSGRRQRFREQGVVRSAQLTGQLKGRELAIGFQQRVVGVFVIAVSVALVGAKAFEGEREERN